MSGDARRLIVTTIGILCSLLASTSAQAQGGATSPSFRVEQQLSSGARTALSSSFRLNGCLNYDPSGVAASASYRIEAGCGAVVPLVVPPTLSKAFGPATIDAGGVSTLTITLLNPNPTVAILTAPLVDSVPSGVVIAATPNVGTTCGGVGTPVAVAGGSTVTLPAGRSIPANGSCTLTVNVTAAVGGSYVNTLAAGALVTSNGNNAAPAVATLTVVPVVPPSPTAPTLGKAFNPATIAAGGVSTLTIALSNPDVAVATLTAPLVDTVPSGVVIAATPNVGTTCGGVEAPVAVAGATTVTLPAGRSIPANGSCTLTVNVTAAVGGSYVNTLAAGALVTSNGNNAVPAVATLTVVPVAPPGPTAPTLGKAFNPATIAVGGVSTLTITLSNPDVGVATLTASLVDTLPSGVVIAATPNVGTTCSGAGAPVAVVGGSTVTLPAGRSIPANGSCTLTVDVTAAVAGPHINTLAAGALVTSNGNNAAPAVATLNGASVTGIPTLSRTGLACLVVLLAGTALVLLRRHRRLTPSPRG